MPFRMWTVMLAFLATPCFAQPPSVPSELRAHADAVIEGYYASLPEKRREALRKLSPGEAAEFTPFHINADGIPDWRIEYSLVAMCGTGGCANEVHVSSPGGGFDMVLRRQFLTMKVQHDAAGAALLRLSVHGGNCTGHSQTECALGFRWDQANRRFVDAMLSGTATRRYGFSMIEPVVGTEASPPFPSALVPALREAEAACKRYRRSARPARFGAEPVADFDGDGRLDWLVGQGAHCSVDDGAEGRRLPATLWLDRDKGPERAVSIATGNVFFDVSNVRPILAINCRSEEGGCTEDAFVWDAAGRMMRRIEPVRLSPADAAFLSESIVRLKPGGDAVPLPSPEVAARASALVTALERDASPTDPLLARARLVQGAMVTLAGGAGGLEPLRRAVQQLAYQTVDEDDAYRLASLYRARAARGTDEADDRYYGARDAVLILEDTPLDGISLRGLELAIEEGFRSGYMDDVGNGGARADGLGIGPGAWVETGIIAAYEAELARRDKRFADAEAIETASLDQLAGRESPAAAVLHAGLAKSLMGLGRLAEAEGHARSAARLRIALAGANESEAMAAQSDLAAALLSLRRTSEAEMILRQTVATLRGRAGDNYMLARALRRLAEAALDSGRLRDAADLLKATRAEETRLDARDVVDPAYMIYETNEPARLLARTHMALGETVDGAAEFADLVGGLNFVSNVETASIGILLDVIEFGGSAFSDEQLAEMAKSLDAPGRQPKDIAARAVEVAEEALPAGHPMIARAHRLFARALIDAADPAAEPALTAALALAHAQQQDGQLGGMEIRNDAVRYYLAHDEDGGRARTLALAREAVVIARARRAALGSEAWAGVGDPELRRAFIGLVAVAASVVQQQTGAINPALADEAFRALQQAELSLTAIAMRRNILRSLAESANDKNILPLFLEFRRMEREHEALGRLYLSAVTGSSGGDPSALQIRQLAARDKMEKLDALLRAALPRYREAAADNPLSLGEALERLGGRQGLYIIGGDERDLAAMLVSATGPRFLYARGGGALLARDGARLRCMLDKTFCTEAISSAIDSDTLRANYPWDAIDPFDLSAAVRVSEAILAPLAAGLGGLDTLYAVQQGRTGDLPLAILPLTRSPADDAFNPSSMAGVEWLIDRVAVVQLPAADILTPASGAPAAPTSDTFLGIGNPVLHGKRPASSGLGSIMARSVEPEAYLADVGAIAALRPLPGTQRELEGLARALGASEANLITGVQATEARVKSDRRLASVDMISFATHGLLPGNLDGLSEPGLVLTPPAKASDGDDGLLLASEVARLELKARQVLLSACNTASASGAPGSDSLSTLARAFLVAGAETVIASRWSVLDDATAALVTTMATRQAANPALTPAGALREAMIAVRSGHMVDGAAVPGWRESWKHPRAWGPFILVASRDSRRQTSSLPMVND